MVAAVLPDHTHYDVETATIASAGFKQGAGSVNRSYEFSTDAIANWCQESFTGPIDGDNEGFGMVFIEASACGKPVIAGVAGGTGAAVVDGVTGYRVDADRLEAVIDSITRVLKDPALAESLGRAGYQRVGREFSWERVAEKTSLLQKELG